MGTDPPHTPFPMTVFFGWLVALTWVFVPRTLDPFLLPRQALFTIGGFGCVAWIGFHGTDTGRWRNPWVRWFLVWVAGSLAWTFYGPLVTTPTTATDLAFSWFVLLPTVDVFLGCLLVSWLVTRLLGDHPERCALLTHLLCWSSVVVAGYSLLQYLGFDQFFLTPDAQWLSLDRPNHMVATMGNMSYVSMYLGLTTPLFLLMAQKRYLVGLALVLLALALMGRKYGIGVGGFGLLVYGWLRARHVLQTRPWIWWGLTGVLVLGVVLGGVLSWGLVTSNVRWRFWSLMLTQMRQRPLTGFGLGSFALQYFVHWDDLWRTLPVGSFAGSRWMWAHNDLWQAGYELGLVGMGCAIGIAWSVLRRAWRATSTPFGAGWFACGLSLCVMSVLNFPWHFAPTAATGLVIWAMNEVNAGGVA